MPILQVKLVRNIRIGDRLVFLGPDGSIVTRLVMGIEDRGHGGRSFLIDVDNPQGTVELDPDEMVVFVGAWG